MILTEDMLAELRSRPVQEQINFLILENERRFDEIANLTELVGQLALASVRAVS